MLLCAHISISATENGSAFTRVYAFNIFRDTAELSSKKTATPTPTTHTLFTPSFTLFLFPSFLIWAHQMYGKCLF